MISWVISLISAALSEEWRPRVTQMLGRLKSVGDPGRLRMMAAMLGGQAAEASPDEAAAIGYIVRKLNERADELEASPSAN